ncbi:hypothetical protein RHT_01587 [Candidatus Rhabdochlamydia sp. T3358]|nr:hypothetical protein RHT_01587 [Candidatus Rhabdochlamydia sp. T3358]
MRDFYFHKNRATNIIECFKRDYFFYKHRVKNIKTCLLRDVYNIETRAIKQVDPLFLSKINQSI